MNETPDQNRERRLLHGSRITDHPTSPDVLVVELTQGKVTLIDAQDRGLVEGQSWNWQGRTGSRSAGYAVRKRPLQRDPGRRPGTLFLGREVMAAKLGRELAPDEKVAYHDGNTLDNRRFNLRLRDRRGQPSSPEAPVEELKGESVEYRAQAEEESESIAAHNDGISRITVLTPGALEVITSRLQFDLAKAKQREHILEGLKIALKHLDAVIGTFRHSRNADTARVNLIRKFKFNEVQAQAILDLQLRRLVALERRKVEEELAEVRKTIKYLEDLLKSKSKILELTKEEQLELKKKYGGALRTQIETTPAAEFTAQDLIPDEDVLATISEKGHVLRYGDTRLLLFGSALEALMQAGDLDLAGDGAAGIAVGTATNIPPHNLGEVADAIVHLIDHPKARVDDLLHFIPGPDFPTGGIVHDANAIRAAYATGKGRLVIRAKAHVEDLKGNHQAIVITELPYQVNKANLAERIADLAKEGRIKDISNLRDESDRSGIRLVIELKREAVPQAVLNQLFKYTAMQTTFDVNLLLLVDGKPRVLTLKRLLELFVDFRQEVITRRSQFDLAKAKQREHILEGLKIALDNLDAVIETIRRSRDADTARTNLMRQFKLTEVQVQAILDLQLRRLAALERRKVEEELAEARKTIKYLEDLLKSKSKILELIKEEQLELKRKYGDARRTQIEIAPAAEPTAQDLIPDEDVLATISEKGHVLRGGHEQLFSPEDLTGELEGETAEYQAQVEAECERIDSISRQPVPELKDPGGRIVVQTSVTPRSAAFRFRVRTQYDNKCAVCGSKLHTPDGKPEAQSAHVYPKAHDGSDDPRNGICLCGFHHWAFDCGWFSVADDLTILVKDGLPEGEGYQEIRSYAGKKLSQPSDPDLRPHPIFLSEHRKLHGF